MKNEPLRLSVTAARERDNPRGRVESIRAGMKVLADRTHAEQRHKPGWAPAPDYRVVAKADVYKGRDYESLMRYHQAHKRDIGYWEDAPRGLKFGGAGGQNTVPVEAQKPDAAPSSDDPYEPVGTVPIVGDRVCKCIDNGGGAPCGYVGRVRDIVEGTPPYVDAGDYAPASCNFQSGSWRILARQKAPQAQAPQGLQVRAWRCSATVGVNTGGKEFVCELGGWLPCDYSNSPHKSLADWVAYHSGAELPAPEALKQWRSCATALRLNVETGKPLQNKPVA